MLEDKEATKRTGEARIEPVAADPTSDFGRTPEQRKQRRSVNHTELGTRRTSI